MVLGRSHSIASTQALLLNRSSEPSWQTVLDESRLMAEREDNSPGKSRCSSSAFRQEAEIHPMRSLYSLSTLFGNSVLTAGHKINELESVTVINGGGRALH